MSSALVRQALELVDPEDSADTKRGSRKTRQRQLGQDHRHLYKSKAKKRTEPVKSKEQLADENIKKLLALSRPTANSATAGKIVERATSRKPLADKIEVKLDEHKSILFPENETFENCEKELFCS